MKLARILSLIILIFIISEDNFSQFLAWYTIPNAPTNPTKLDDCFFINANTGWVITGQSPSGAVYKTTNGGVSWVFQIQINQFLRCIGFADSLNGWIGVLNTNLIYKTSNGGTTWTMQTLPTPSSSGTCGISVVNSSLIYACGRYEEPAYFIKSTNGGNTWSAVNMSAFVSTLVDCYFYSPDSGFVVGGTGSFYTNTKPRILFTSDGGSTWAVRYTGQLTSQWCWKISFAVANTGYVSIESWRDSDTVSYLKTTDKGVSWNAVCFTIDTNKYHSQSVFFVSETLGWVGGYLCCTPGVSNGKVYETTDGGFTWQPNPWGYNVNRFRYINDSTVYAVGRTVYKYSRDPIGIKPISNQIPNQFSLSQNYPNPFNPKTIFNFQLPMFNYVSLKVYDVLGREITTLVNELLQPGTYEVAWDASNFPSGVYYYKLTAIDYTETKKMVLIK